jgi:hypothetical protein
VNDVIAELRLMMLPDSTRFISKKAAMSPQSFFGSFDTFPDGKRRMPLDIE